MMRRRLAPAKTWPARRAASSRFVERKELTTGCVATSMSKIGRVHAANLSQELNRCRGMNMRMRAIGRKKREKL
jgi:hypothetical protein